MVIKMPSPRGFPDFILGAKKYAKNCPKIVIFFTQFFANISGSNQKFRNRLGDVLFFPTGSPFKTFWGHVGVDLYPLDRVPSNSSPLTFNYGPSSRQIFYDDLRWLDANLLPIRRRSPPIRCWATGWRWLRACPQMSVPSYLKIKTIKSTCNKTASVKHVVVQSVSPNIKVTDYFMAQSMKICK